MYIKPKDVYRFTLFIFGIIVLSENFYDIPQIGPQIDDILTNMYQYLPNFSIMIRPRIICT